MSAAVPAAPARRPSAPPGAPVLATADDRLAADVLRLAAAAGASLEVVATASACVRRWPLAAAVLVGVDLAAPVAALRPDRREQVHVVGGTGAQDPVFRSAVELGATSVLELPQASGWLVQLLGDLSDDQRADGTLLAVTGGSGGVGASVLACALAAVAARCAPAALLDLDPLGPGLRRLAGLEVPAPGRDRATVTWRTLAEAPGRLGARALREALPRQDGLGVLDGGAGPGGPPPDLVREVVAAARRGHGHVVLDLPRSPAVTTPDLLARCDRVLLVVRAALPQVVAAARVAEGLLADGAAVEVVVRSRRRDPDRAAEVARAVGAPLAAEVPDQRRLEEHLELGVGPVHGRRSTLGRVAAAILDGRGAW